MGDPQKRTGAQPVVAGRIESVDALRGFDMFWIIGGKPAVIAFAALFINPPPEWFLNHFRHVEWEGFSFWDLIMPLFLFVSGVSMPFSFAKWFETGRSKRRLYLKIAKRVAILWVLGMACQGNLLAYDLSKLALYSNTLQAIAAGYLIAAMFALHTPIRIQLAGAGALMAIYWLLMAYVPFPGHAAGTLEPTANLAMFIDETLLGSFRDGTTYTWILSSLGFGATVLLGALGGHVLRADASGGDKTRRLLIMGGACLALGWVWSYAFPIIKHIWSSSMILWAGGWSFLLLAAFYWIIDVKGCRRWAFPFVVIGMNAIAVYTATELYSFENISNVFVGELAPRLGEFGAFLQKFGALAVVWLILLYMYRKKTFLRV